MPCFNGFNEWPGCGGDGLLVQGTADGCVQSVTFGEVVQQLLQHGGRSCASRGEVPQAVRDGRLVRSYDPGGLVGGGFVDALDAQGLGFVDGVGGVV